jgi:hypothetical protein
VAYVSGGLEWHDANGDYGWVYNLPGISLHGYTHANGDSGTVVTAGGTTITHTSGYGYHTWRSYPAAKKGVGYAGASSAHCLTNQKARRVNLVRRVFLHWAEAAVRVRCQRPQALVCFWILSIGGFLCGPHF